MPALFTQTPCPASISIPFQTASPFISSSNAAPRKTSSCAPFPPIPSASIHIQIRPSEILLPEKENAAQLTHLRRFLHERAHEYLLPRLEGHIRTTRLTPSAISLSNAKTFWGVCRHTTGIRLNWRLIGAPEYVADYVCLHELAHLRHPDHGPAFWALTHSLTPHVDQAERWLKAHGSELFRLG